MTGYTRTMSGSMERSLLFYTSWIAEDELRRLQEDLHQKYMEAISSESRFSHPQGIDVGIIFNLTKIKLLESNFGLIDLIRLNLFSHLIC